jgi:ABC-type Na+ efflux pump permease subunit
MFGKIIGLIATILSIIGLISLYLSYIPALNYATKGDIANATDAVANATADNLIEEACMHATVATGSDEDRDQ